MADLQSAFRLDGRVALVSNPSPGDLRRRFLAVAVSDDGREFTKMHALRRDPAGAARLKGMHKVPGFDYPNAIEARGRLWVTYAVNNLIFQTPKGKPIALDDLPKLLTDKTVLVIGLTEKPLTEKEIGEVKNAEIVVLPMPKDK